VGYSIDSSTGALTPLPSSPFNTGFDFSASLGIDQSGKFLYEISGLGAGVITLRSYSIEGTGELTEILGNRLSLATTARRLALIR